MAQNFEIQEETEEAGGLYAFYVQDGSRYFHVVVYAADSIYGEINVKRKYPKAFVELVGAYSENTVLEIG